MTTDPRTHPDFAPAHFPLCDGRPAPPGVGSSEDGQLMLEFLAAYYEINRQTALLVAARAGGSTAAASAPLEGLARAHAARDALEDRCAPVGFLAEPVVAGVFVTDVRFTTARRAARTSEFHRTSVSVIVPPDSPPPPPPGLPDVPPLPRAWRS